MADQTLTIGINANMNIGNVLSGVKQLQGAFSALKLPANLTANVYKEFEKLQKQLREFQDLQGKTNLGKADLKSLDKLRSSIDSTYGHLIEEMNELSSKKIILEADATKIKEAEATVKSLQQQIQDKLNKVDLKFEVSKNNTLDIGLNSFVTQLESASGRSKQFKASLEEIKQAMASGNTSNLGAQLSNAINQAQKLKGAGSDVLKVFSQMGIIKLDTKKLEDAEYRAKKFEQALKIISPVLQTLNADTGELKDKLATAFEVRNTAFENGIKNGRNEVQKINTELDKSRGVADKAGAAFKGMADQTVRAAEEIKQLQQSTQYFFSLRNMINLLKQGLRDAVQTVRDLDAAMTETAVVTDFSVGDMWSKLPEYTANANKLGATIQDMYESTTLYYQQGLNTEQSMAIAAETMKMARIAGLEAKDATDMMTAALRGFNMELNEASATRINDVYSNLAAKTASDTEEIGKAMQRTASIAHSAGMSFEGTAAFLAQAVETTREPAENIGTAMKTIIARFQEMKKNPLEITEVEGEEVSYNKIDTALQSIGVSLKDTNGQFRELDKVFLDISKRWDGLTQTQQRYIATVAAGSRQQSRFIAMMGDYERTTELMSYATDAEGASQEQFNKTLDSLEAKINKFKNAWDQFLMGIMNDSATKFVVDAGTEVLGIINRIINALSFNGNSGLIKSVLSLGTAFLSLKTGGNLLNKLIGGMGGLVDPTTGGFWKGFWGAGKTTSEGTPATGLAGKITTPIVAKLNELIAVTKTGNSLSNNKQVTSTIGEYKNISSLLRNVQSTNMGTIGSLFGQLSNEHAYTAYRNTPGTVDAMKQAALGWLGSKQLPNDAQKIGQQLMKNIFKGMDKKEISVKDGIKLLGKPELWGKYFGSDVANNFSKQYTEQTKSQLSQALKNTWQELGMTLAAPETKKAYLNTEEGRNRFKSTYQKNRQFLNLDGISNLQDTAVIQNNLQHIANNVGILGSKFSSAGLSIQMFGSQLGQLHPALQGIGSLLTQVGMAINTFGMGISGIGTVINKIGGRFAMGVAGAQAAKYGGAAMAEAVASGAVKASAVAKASAPVVAKGFISGFTSGMSAGPIAAIIVGVLTGGILIAKSIAEKKAKEAGEEVRKNFESGFTETSKKIDSISDYKDRFNELAQGVDQFGHNINLTTEEYDEYLSISRDLQELSPSLISGYNAEGQAILRKGEALDEVINKLKEERQLSLTDYISNDSLDKLIGEFRTSDAYKEHHTTIKDTPSQNGVAGAFDSDKTNISKAIRKAELEWSDFSQILDELGIGSADSINQLTNRQLSLISDHYTDILNKIKEANPQIKEEAEEGLKEAFANTSNSIEDVMTEGAPVIESLRQWMGQEKIDAVGLQLSEEFVSGFNSGLDGLMLEGLTNDWKPEQYKTELREYAKEWEYLAGPTSAYSQVLSEADEIQQQYLDHIGEDGAVEDYENNVEELAIKLESLAEQYKGTGAAGEVFAEQCQQQANALRNYATEGAVSLGEALNILSNKFTEARGAKERFDKAIEGGDYYTAAEGFRSIADTVLDEKNSNGDGSLTAWIGAEQLLGQNFVDNAKDWADVENQVKKVNKLFDDGIEGVYNFNDMLVEAVNSGKDLSGLGEVVEGAFHFNFDNVDNLQKYADLLGISEDVLVGMIDKSRQFMAFNAGNNKQIRQALEQSEQAMVGQTYGKNGKTNIYTSEASFRQEAYTQGIRGNDYTKTKKDLAKEQNVRFLTVESLKANKGDLGLDSVLKDIGLEGRDETLNNTVAALTKMGFNLEEQKNILTSKGIKLADGEVTDTEVEQAYNENAYALENPTVSGIANDTGVIATAATAMLAQMGIMTDSMKQDIKEATSNPTIQGYKDRLNQEFTDSKTRNAARQEVENQIADYATTMHLLEQGGLKDTAEYQALANRTEELTQALNEEANAWNEATLASQTLTDGLGANSQDQNWLNQNAIDIQTTFDTTSLQDGAKALAQLKEEGNLSAETVDNLTNKFLALHATELLNMSDADFARTMSKFGIYGQEIDTIHRALQQPFIIQTQLTGADLKDYIASIDGLTDEEKSIILKTYVRNSDKVTDLINTINTEFGNDSEETKSIIIQATAKLASGDTEGAHNLLQEQFGDKTEEIESKLNIICDGSIANPGDVKESIEQQLQSLQVNADVKANIKADTSKIKLKQTGSINYTTKVDERGIKTARQNAQKKVTMPVDANTDAAERKISQLKNPGSATIDVYMRKAGSWTASVTVQERARGQNYSIPASQSISFGSAANGLNISKKKQTNSLMTALVGEEGYEIGYIPSEGRSVIFGANGPEMTSFPSDTVIYPHNQSKEIIRRGKGNHKTAGSFVDGILPTRNNGSASNGGGRGNTDKKDSSKSGNDKKTEKEVIKILQKGGKVLVWWENIGRRVDKIQRDAEKSQKNLDKLLKTFGTTADSYKTAGQQLVKELNTTIDLAKKRETRALTELEATAKTPKTKKLTQSEKKSAKAATERLNAAKAAVKEAKKTKGKGDDAKAQKELDKARKSYNNNKGVKKQKYNKNLYQGLEAIGARVQVSYETTKTTKDKKGKTKKTKVTKNKNINLGSYIKYNSETQMYELDQAAITKVSKKNRSLGEAIKQAADKQLQDLYSKLNTAQDDEIKATEELQQFYDTAYETFDQWDKTITEIYLLGQQLSQLSSQRQVANNAVDTIYAKLEAGFSNVIDELPQIATALQKNADIILSQAQITAATTTAAWKEYQDVITGTSATQKWLANKDSSEAARDYNIMQATQSFLKEAGLDGVNFNLDKAIQALDNLYDQRWSGDTYDKIKEGLDKISEAEIAYYDTLADSYTSITDFYNLVEEYQSFMSDFEDSLIKGIEEQADVQIDKLNKLNSSLNTAAKDIIDEVKRKLDERRNREDNEKTEQEISQKQQRLAALRADTAGGHAAEIAQLEKEIANSQKDYERSLEDQLLEKLSNQQDEAAKQRERQINLLEIQKDLATVMGSNVEEINKWLANPTEYYNQIREAWLQNEGYYDKGANEQKQIEERWEATWAQYNGYNTTLPYLTNMQENIAKIASWIDKQAGIKKTSDVNVQTTVINEVKDVQTEHIKPEVETPKVDSSKVNTTIEVKNEPTVSATDPYKGLKESGYTEQDLNTAGKNKESVAYMSAGAITRGMELSEKYSQPITPTSQEEPKEDKNDTSTTDTIQKLYDSFLHNRGDADGAHPGSLGKTGYLQQVERGDQLSKSEFQVAKELANTSQLSWVNVLTAAKAAGRSGKVVKNWSPNSKEGSQFRKAFEKVYGSWSKFKTGGLANFTGPAWLDGTPSKPELVLNAADTKNFIALKDVLSRAIGSTSHIENSYGGDATYEININVDHLNNDYDVDKVVERVKKKIVQDSGYRNVTQVRNFR